MGRCVGRRSCLKYQGLRSYVPAQGVIPGSLREESCHLDGTRTPRQKDFSSPAGLRTSPRERGYVLSPIRNTSHSEGSEWADADKHPAYSVPTSPSLMQSRQLGTNRSRGAWSYMRPWRGPVSRRPTQELNTQDMSVGPLIRAFMR